MATSNSRFTFLALLISACGCAPPAPESIIQPINAPVSITAPSELPVADGNVGDRIHPSVDAGMLADEFEHSQRLNTREVERLDATTETVQNPKE